MNEANILRGLRYGKLDSRARAWVEALALIEDGKASRELHDLMIDIDDEVDDNETPNN